MLQVYVLLAKAGFLPRFDVISLVINKELSDICLS